VLSAAQFWASMQRWGVEDAAALQLIGYPGRIGISGKRPRFRFTTRQARISGLLAELDGALEAAGKPPAWLHRTQRAAPFGGRTPLALMLEGPGGIAAVLRRLHRDALAASLKASGTDHPR